MSTGSHRSSDSQQWSCAAVLLLGFNRPVETARVLERIERAAPPRLYIAVDGPRPDHPSDDRACEEVRAQAANIRWDCDVRTRFRADNLGCKEAVSDAIDWFFTHERAGIILEDDCLPDSSFFRYCSELLQRYEHHPQVMMISGDRFHPRPPPDSVSYEFMTRAHIWGWATWRRAWRSYDPSIAAWRAELGEDWLRGRGYGSNAFTRYWSRIFDDVANGSSTSWAYPWTFAIWSRDGLAVAPAHNLVSNLGFGESGTHTLASTPAWARTEVRPLRFPLDHPTTTKPRRYLDEWSDRKVHQVRWRRVEAMKARLLNIGIIRRFWERRKRSSGSRASA